MSPRSLPLITAQCRQCANPEKNPETFAWNPGCFRGLWETLSGTRENSPKRAPRSFRVFWETHARLDGLKPNIRKRSEEKQQKQQLRSSHSPIRKLDVGQTAVAQDYRWVNRWVPGVIRSHSALLSYEVRVAPNTVWRRHIDQLRESVITVNPNTDDPATQPNPAVFSATP